MTETTEQWRPIAAFEGHYEASNLGRIRSVKRSTPHIMSPVVTDRGYVNVMICMYGKYRPYGVHRLVLLAFCGEPPEGYHACHYNGDPTDNRLENLRWDTPVGNAEDMRRHNRHRNGRKTHCKNGHEFTPENTYMERRSGGGSRRCLICKRQTENRKYHLYGKTRTPSR
jgi:hypothetical protein